MSKWSTTLIFHFTLMIVLLAIFALSERIELVFSATGYACWYYNPEGENVSVKWIRGNPANNGREVTMCCLSWWHYSTEKSGTCMVQCHERDESQRTLFNTRFYLYYNPTAPCLFSWKRAYVDTEKTCSYENPNYTTPTSPFTEDPNPAVRIYGNPATILMLFPLIHEKYVGAY